MAEEEVEVKKKSPLVKIILMAVGGLVAVVGIVIGTLFVVGFFDKKDQTAVEARLAELEAQLNPKEGASEAASAAGPQKVSKASPELQRFQSTYMELDKPLVSNMTGTRKVIQVNLAMMTHYDERVFQNAKKHEFALRSAALDVMRQTTEAELSEPDFRKKLAGKIRDELNKILVKYEDFGGIEEVFFTSFVVQ
ncbi:MAG: flagellar basal body-associated FliL family protein [Burkholderiaceae bacterium]